MPSGTVLELAGLIAGWRRPVVGPVSLALARGDVVGVWGANGSGKSTLLAAVAGQARRFDGRLRLAPGVGLAVQPQAPVRLDPLPVTGRELLAVAGADPNACDLPATLAALLPQRLDRISGGQHQLLCVWAALAGTADLVLLDEPTNNLDPTHTAVLADMLAERRADRAVLLVSHERAFLQAHCGRILALDAAGALATDHRPAPPPTADDTAWT
ncbi:ATP-binding cassette domain-containing protein [uncultured Thiohalocapsa sp.]|uniref:ATP-binding cassette domain-containing protein n=1 Tax=uncultured Thiohalocapsa sp. TaxID=768990 RepID=UPI0025CEEAB4|nr:ATP-binding cassette domain-containing protein [uncultured Thiohalocapsa sp.]